MGQSSWYREILAGNPADRIRRVPGRITHDPAMRRSHVAWLDKIPYKGNTHVKVTLRDNTPVIQFKEK
jgi:hypothetical protein